MSEDDFELKVEPIAITADNYEEKSYTITGTTIKNSVDGRKHIVLEIEGGFEIFANKLTFVNLTKAYGWQRKHWVGKLIYPGEIKEYPKGKSITWISTES